jgi:L-fuconolactonase
MSLEWANADQDTRFHLMTEVTLAYMRAVGVDRAVLHPISSVEWGEHAASLLPDRFSLVVGALVAAEDGTMALRGAAGSVPIPSIDEWVAERSSTPGVVGIRLGRPSVEQFGPALEACAREGLPVFILPPSTSGDPRSFGGDFTDVSAIARRYPNLTVVIDHLGLPQWPSRLDSPPFRALPDLLELAAYPNVAIKFAGAHSMSQQPYPFDDLWPHLTRIIDAYGTRRLMWGTDISRFYERIGFSKFPASGAENESAYVDGIAPELLTSEDVREVPHSYAEALFHLRGSDRLSADDKEWLFGRSAQELLRWP